MIGVRDGTALVSNPATASHVTLPMTRHAKGDDGEDSDDGGEGFGCIPLDEV